MHATDTLFISTFTSALNGLHILSVALLGVLGLSHSQTPWHRFTLHHYSFVVCRGKVWRGRCRIQTIENSSAAA